MIDNMNLESSINKDDDDFMEDRETKKKKVHPYRKYQLIEILLAAIFIILVNIVFGLNKELNVLLKKEQNLFTQITDIKGESKEIQDLYNRVELNYKGIYQLDKTYNIDIIHTLDELDLLTNFIGDGSGITYSICYKATEHGDSALKFREFCEALTPLVFLIETTDGYRFGAYTTLDFKKESPNNFREDANAFIFSFDTRKKYKILQTESAIFDSQNSFPRFGKGDIIIGNNILTQPTSSSAFPISYESDPEATGDYLLNGGMSKFTIKEMEVLSCFIYAK